MKNLREKENINIADLIGKRLEGVIDKEEDKVLQEWIDKSEGNKKLYLQLTSDHHLFSRLKEYYQCDLTHLRSRIISLTSNSKKRIGISRTAVRIAAVFLLFLSTGVIGYMTFKTPPVKENPVYNILPGSEKAYLLTSDGTTIDLSHISDLHVDDIVLKNDAGIISYETKNISLQQNVLKYNTLFIPKGGEYGIQLSDGTKVWLNSESRLHYPVTFFGEKREVYLEGEGYFEVTPSEVPFYVHAGDFKVEVLGTSFNIMTYQNEPTVHTTLVNGKVDVQVKNNSDHVILHPGQQVRYNRENNTTSVMPVDAGKYMAWKNSSFAFENETFAAMMRKFERWYDVEIEIQSAEIREEIFTGNLPKMQGIQELLKMLSNNYQIDYFIDSNKVIIKKTDEP